jgi:plastocyanin
MPHTGSLTAWALALTVLVGCGGGSSSSGTTASSSGSRKPSAGGAKVEVVAAADTDSEAGVIVGEVRFLGEAPRRLPINPIANTVGCAEHEDTPLIEHYVIQNGRVANVVVSVRRMPSSYVAPAPPTTPFVVDQKGCLYVPHVSAVQVGRKVQVDNSDPTSHNVHVLAQLNESSNRTIGAGGKPIDFDFPRAEVVRFICDIHPWMGAYLQVVEHPFFAVTGADGSFRIEGLPPGEYEFEAWHEKLGKRRTKKFTLGAGGEARVEFTFER